MSAIWYACFVGSPSNKGIQRSKDLSSLVCGYVLQPCTVVGACSRTECGGLTFTHTGSGGHAQRRRESNADRSRFPRTDRPPRTLSHARSPEGDKVIVYSCDRTMVDST
ncbi:hypothetical protein evm_010671 [Chilo suppressalis]|nr:hypothetical protein evm_010671 [Chilo suppressalis]